MTLFRLQINSVFSHCWPCDFILQLFELWVFFPLSSVCSMRAGDSVLMEGVPPCSSTQSPKRLRFLGPSSAGAGWYSCFDSVIQVSAKGDHEICDLLSWMLFFIISSPICIFKVRKTQVSVSLLVFCSTFVDTDTCRRITDKNINFWFCFLGWRTESLSWESSSGVFLLAFFWLETFPWLGYNSSVITEVQLALK